MIIDSHCHAWTRWPYQPPVPDDAQRGRIEQLLHEMDQHGVEQAVVICAQIDRNPDNNAYIAEQVPRYAPRIHQFPDVDSFWSPTYHQPGAAQRLKAVVEQRGRIKGFTHYLAEADDGAWLASEDGHAFFRVAAERNLIASIACHPHQQPAIRHIAAAFPSLPFLCHHLAGVRAGEGPPHAGLKEVLVSAQDVVCADDGQRAIRLEGIDDLGDPHRWIDPMECGSGDDGIERLGWKRPILERRDNDGDRRKPSNLVPKNRRHVCSQLNGDDLATPFREGYGHLPGASTDLQHAAAGSNAR